MLVFAPALSKAWALSYSQFVPGNTGINTVGFATLFLHTYTLSALKRPVSTAFFSSLTVEWNTFSSLSFQLSRASSSEKLTPQAVNVLSSVTSPITLAPAFTASETNSAGTSAMISAISFVKSSFALMLSSILTPRPLPKAILETEAAIPYASSAYAETIAFFFIRALIFS